MQKEKGINRGNAMTMILAVLCDSPRHGYDIAREVERRSQDLISFNDGTLYPILHALEQEGFIDSRWEQPAGERKRRVYSLNQKGLFELQRQVEEWQQFSHAVNDVLAIDWITKSDGGSYGERI